MKKYLRVVDVTGTTWVSRVEELSPDETAALLDGIKDLTNWDNFFLHLDDGTDVYLTPHHVVSVQVIDLDES